MMIQIDKDGGGQILFREFAEWAIANNVLDKLKEAQSDEDD
jgi:hypothetical protein